MEKRKWVQGHHLRKCHAIKNHLVHLPSLRSDQLNSPACLSSFFIQFWRPYSLFLLQMNSIMPEQNHLLYGLGPLIVFCPTLYGHSKQDFPLFISTTLKKVVIQHGCAFFYKYFCPLYNGIVCDEHGKSVLVMVYT